MATRAYFNNIKDEIVKELNDSQKSIKVAVAWFTDSDLFKILIKKAQKGVRVELFIANHSINLNSSIDYEELNNCGGMFSFIGEGVDNEPIMHHKFCVIDNETLIFGSYNWTNKARLNFESINISKEDYKLIIDFYEQFEQIKNFQSNSIQNLSHKLKNICIENSIDYENTGIFLQKKKLLHDYIVSASKDYLIVRKQVGLKKIPIVGNLKIDVKIYEKHEHEDEECDDETCDIKQICYIIGREPFMGNDNEKIKYVNKYGEIDIPIWKYGVVDYNFNVIISTNYDYLKFGSKGKLIFGNIVNHTCVETRTDTEREYWEEGDSSILKKVSYKIKEEISQTKSFKYGMLDLNNNELLPCEYREILFFDDAYFLTLSDEYITIFNHKMNVINTLKIDKLGEEYFDCLDSFKSHELKVVSYLDKRFAVLTLSDENSSSRKCYFIDSIDGSDDTFESLDENQVYWGNPDCVEHNESYRNIMQYEINLIKNNYYYFESEKYKFVFQKDN